MILSDYEISLEMQRSRIVIDPMPPDHAFQPASVDLTLGNKFIYENFDRDGPFKLESNKFILGSTAESLAVPSDMVARIEGKSSLGRLGLMVHVTAGFIDPGWQLAPITLEFYNLSSKTIWLEPGMQIAQICFERLTSPASRPYGHPGLKSHYVGQQGVTASRYGEK